MIPQSNLSRLSNRLYQPSTRRILEDVLERDYCIAWFLIGLSKSELRQKLAFKGGTCLKRCHFDDYRFSEDLDFTLLETMKFEDIKSKLEPICRQLKLDSGNSFRYLREDPDQHRNSFTFFLGYEGPLPRTSRGKEIKVDLTITEQVVFDLVQRPVLKSYDEYVDLPEGKTVLCYSLKEIAAEKTVALLDRARTEPRDLYDLWYLTVNNHAHLSEIVDAVEQKLKFRGKTLKEVKGEFEKKESRLEKTWQPRLAPQMASLPEFEGVFRAVKREFRQAKLVSGA